MHNTQQEVLRLLTQRGKSFSAAESCTGGLIAKMFTDLPGASRAFVGGVVSYTNGVKHRVLGVPEEVLATVDEKFVESEKEAVVQRFNVSDALDITKAVRRAMTGAIPWGRCLLAWRRVTVQRWFACSFPATERPCGSRPPSTLSRCCGGI